MKLRYRIEDRGWFIPQFFSKGKTWRDVQLRHLGRSSNQLHIIAKALGRKGSYHFLPGTKEEKEKDCPVFFENELKVFAFLGAFKAANANRTKEFD